MSVWESMCLVVMRGPRGIGAMGCWDWSADPPWLNRNATRFGTPKSFIFNLAPYDVKIGYSPQGPQSCCLWASQDAVTWGIQDLCFKVSLRISLLAAITRELSG